MSNRQRDMSAELLELIAERFRALGEPVRLTLLQTLRDGERTVGELAESSGYHPANVSKHLGILYRMGWVARRKEGLYVHYRLADERVVQLCDIMCGKLEDETESRRSTLIR